jgi:cytochrome c553
MMSGVPCRVVAVAVSLGFALVASGAWAQTPWPVPDSEKTKKSPVAPGPKAIEQGKKIAQVNCATCHGNTGTGNGPAAMALSPKPPDWTSKKVQDETDGEIFWKITRPAGAPCRRGSTCPRTTAGRSCSTSARSGSSALAERPPDHAVAGGPAH